MRASAIPISRSRRRRRPPAANCTRIVSSSSIKRRVTWNGITRHSPTTFMIGIYRSRPSILRLPSVRWYSPPAKGGFVFAFDAMSGQLLWKTPVGIHNGHDGDDQLALDGTLHLQTPYTLYPGEAGGVETNMAEASGVVYVPVENLPETFATATAPVGTSNFYQGKGEMVAIDIATGKPLWATQLPQLLFG